MLPKFLEPILVLAGLIHFRFRSSRYCYEDKAVVKVDQYKQLKRLLCVAYDEIPFYRNKYIDAGFDPHSDFNTLEQFSNVPLLSKVEARSFQDELINKKRSRFSLRFTTSGSTGQPFTSFVSPRQWIIEQSCVWRHWSWAGYKFRDRMAIVRSHVPKNEHDLIKWDRLRNFIYFSPFHLTDDHIQIYLNEMVKMKIKFIRGYPSSIAAIADFVRRHPSTKLPKFKAVLTASERLGSEQKCMIERYLCAPVFNHYGLAEQIVMFGGCERGACMHNYEEYGYLELLDSDDLHQKKIIGTNFNNYAMPLIRYETGDLAEVSPDVCSCSRTSNIVVNVSGREDSTILLGDGSKIPVTNFYTMFEYYGDYFSAWQIIQKPNNQLHIVVDAYDRNQVVNLQIKLEEDIKKRIGLKMILSFNFNGNFHQVSEGKRNPFVRLNE